MILLNRGVAGCVKHLLPIIDLIVFLAAVFGIVGTVVAVLMGVVAWRAGG